jgi:hypothetical protein
MTLTLLQMFVLHMCKIGSVISAKWVRAKRVKGGKWEVRIGARLMVLCANPLKDDGVDRPARVHVAAYKRMVVACLKHYGCVVSVRARNLDNMVIAMTLPNNGMSPTSMKDALTEAFDGSVRVEGA